MANDTSFDASINTEPTSHGAEYWQIQNITSPAQQFMNWTIRLDNTSTTSPSDAAGADMYMRFICETAISMPLAILGTIGNLLAFVVLWRQKQRLSTTLLLQGLAVTDTNILLTTILLRCLRYMYYHTHTPWLEGYMHVYAYIFRWLYPLVYFLRLGDTWLTVLLTIDRFIAVRHPLHAQRLCTVPRAIKNMAFLGIAAFIFSFPRFFEHEIDPSHIHGFSKSPLLENRLYTIAYRIVLFSVLMYALPLIMLVLLNAKLLRTLDKADSYRANVAELKNNRPHRSITATVVTIVIVTIVCHMTAMLTHLVWSLQQCFSHLSHLETPRRYLARISNILVTFNSAINFAIYCLCSRSFRLILARTIRCDLTRGLLRGSSQQSSARISRAMNISLTHNSLLRRKPSKLVIIQQSV